MHELVDGYIHNAAFVNPAMDLPSEDEFPKFFVLLNDGSSSTTLVEGRSVRWRPRIIIRGQRLNPDWVQGQPLADLGSSNYSTAEIVEIIKKCFQQRRRARKL